MTRDITVLRTWILIVAIIAALGTNAVPIIYFLTPWRQRVLGRLFMFQSLAFATAMNLSVIFTVWRPEDILVIFWVNAIVLTTIAMTTSALAWMIWQLKRTKGTYKWKGLRQVQFTDQVYNKLKFIALILLPALAALYFGVSQIWGLPNTVEVMGTITLIDTFLGSLLKISTNTYNSGVIPQPKLYDGTMIVEPGEEGDRLRFTDIDTAAAAKKNELLFRVLGKSS